MSEEMKLEGDFELLQAMNDIRSGSKEKIPHLPEPIFVNKFLPMFASKDPVDVGEWLNVSGNAHNPVNVFDRNGTILFQVPPLLRGVAIHNPGERSRSFYEVAVNAENKSRLSPQYGQAYLEQELKNRLVDTPVEIDYILKWNEIFKRYNYPVIELPAEVQKLINESNLSVEKTVSSEEILDDDGFEEL